MSLSTDNDNSSNISSESGENEILRDHKNVGHHVGRDKKSTLKRTKTKSSTKKQSSCRCDFHPPSNDHPRFASEQAINSFIPSHDIFKFLNPLLLALLQVHFQFQKMSPFQTHPANVWGFLAATCFYCLGLGLEMHIKSRCAILGHVLLISGAFSSVSLVSIFLPRSLGWLPFIIWAILPFMVGRPLLMRVYHWLYQEILNVILQVGNFFGKFMGSTTVQQQHLPQ